MNGWSFIFGILATVFLVGVGMMGMRGADVKVDLQNTQNQVNACLANQKTISGVYSAMESLPASLQEKLNSLQTRLESVKADLAKSQSAVADNGKKNAEDMANLRNELSKLNEEYARVSNELTISGNNNQWLSGQLGNAQNEILRLQQELATAKIIPVVGKTDADNLYFVLQLGAAGLVGALLAAVLILSRRQPAAAQRVYAADSSARSTRRVQVNLQEDEVDAFVQWRRERQRRS